MQVQTRRFGAIEVADDDVYEVPNGIPGFRDMRRVTLLGGGPMPGEVEPSLYWLQDLDDGGLAFMCVVPWVTFPEYEIDIDERVLGIADEADVRVLSLITVHPVDGEHCLSVNLRAPLVVDVSTRRLQQVILSDSRWPVRAPMAVLPAPVS